MLDSAPSAVRAAAHLSLVDLRRQFSDEVVLAGASQILQEKLRRLGKIGNPAEAREMLRAEFGGSPEVKVGAIFLDNNHEILTIETLFHGTINMCHGHPRVVARKALHLNAAAVITCHNYPSGGREPSENDKVFVTELKAAMAAIDVRFLDHFHLSASGVTSFAERGFI